MERWDTLWDGGWTFCFDDSAFMPSTDSFLLGSFPPLRRGWRACGLAVSFKNLTPPAIRLLKHRMLSGGSCRTARETCEDFGWQRCSCLPLPESPAYSMGMNWEWTAVARQHCGGPCLGKRCRMKRMISFPG